MPEYDKRTYNSTGYVFVYVHFIIFVGHCRMMVDAKMIKNMKITYSVVFYQYGNLKQIILNSYVT